MAGPALALGLAACGGGRCSAPPPDAGTDAGEVNRDGGAAILLESRQLTGWNLTARGDHFEVEWQERSVEGYRVYRRPIDGRPESRAWTIETTYSATVLPLGPRPPVNASTFAYGVNPARFPAWYVMGSSAGLSIFATCMNPVVPLMGAAGSDVSWVALPRDCTGACAGSSEASYWQLRFGADGGVEATVTCRAGEPRVLHPDLTYELRSVGLGFEVREFSDAGAWLLPPPGNARRWQFFPREEMLMFAWEESGRYTPPSPPPDDLKHEVRFIRFREPDAGYQVLEPAVAEHLAEIEVARELDDGRVVLAGRPPRWWKATDQRRAVLLSPDSGTVVGVFEFSATRYDVGAIDGGLVIVKELSEATLDGGVIRKVLVEAPTPR